MAGVNNLDLKLNEAHYTLYIIHYTLFVHCTLYIIHYKFDKFNPSSLHYSGMSIKSDSGVGQARKSLSKLGKFDVKAKRNWCSESQLGCQWVGGAEGKARLGASSLNTLFKVSHSPEFPSLTGRVSAGAWCPCPAREGEGLLGPG